MSDRFENESWRETDAGPDPLDELRDAWNSLDAPEPADDPVDADPATRAAVEWMRQAWATVEPTREPSVPRPAPILRPSFARRPLVPLAAAVLLAGFAALLWWSAGDDRDETRDAPAVVDVDPPVTKIEEHRVPQPERVPELPVPEYGHQLASLSSNHLEMRSGPVRLILLTGPGASADGSALPPHSEEDR